MLLKGNWCPCSQLGPSLAITGQPWASLQAFLCLASPVLTFQAPARPSWATTGLGEKHVVWGPGMGLGFQLQGHRLKKYCLVSYTWQASDLWLRKGLPSHANTIVQGSPTQGASDLRQCSFLGLSAPGRWALQLCVSNASGSFPAYLTVPGLPWGEGASLSLSPPGCPHLLRGAGERSQAAPRTVPGQARTLSPRLPIPPRTCQR